MEVNESLLTGESVSVKKNVGDMLYAGSFISSGNGRFRVEKVGKETYLQKLTSKAKKYKRPNSELMNSTKMIIKAVACLIVPIAIGMFFTTYNADISESQMSGVFDYIFPAKVNYAIQRTCTVVIGMIPSGMMLLTYPVRPGSLAGNYSLRQMSQNCSQGLELREKQRLIKYMIRLAEAALCF